MNRPLDCNTLDPARFQGIINNSDSIPNLLALGANPVRSIFFDAQINAIRKKIFSIAERDNDGHFTPKPELLLKVGKHVRRIRGGMTQSQFSLDLGFKESQSNLISKLERGKRIELPDGFSIMLYEKSKHEIPLDCIQVLMLEEPFTSAIINSEIEKTFDVFAENSPSPETVLDVVYDRAAPEIKEAIDALDDNQKEQIKTLISATTENIAKQISASLPILEPINESEPEDEETQDTADDQPKAPADKTDQTCETTPAFDDKVLPDLSPAEQPISKIAPEPADFISLHIQEAFADLSEADAIRALGRVLDVANEARMANPQEDAHMGELEKKLAENHEMLKLYEEQEAQYKQAAENYQNRIDELTQQVETQARLAQSANARADAVQTTRTLSDSDNWSLVCWNRFDILPTRPADAIKLLTTLFDKRVVFNKSGTSTLTDYIKDCARSGKYNRINEALAIVRALAAYGWPIWFEESIVTTDMENHFKAVSGFELSMHETEGTMTNDHMRELRTTTYNGKTLTSELHIKGKIGNRKGVRVYFALDKEDKKLVIFHFGDHLDTVGSSRGKAH